MKKTRTNLLIVCPFHHWRFCFTDGGLCFMPFDEKQRISVYPIVVKLSSFSAPSSPFEKKREDIEVVKKKATKSQNHGDFYDTIFVGFQSLDQNVFQSDDF
eukprot:Sdes_comp15923_c0_seq2m5058